MRFGPRRTTAAGRRTAAGVAGAPGDAGSARQRATAPRRVVPRGAAVVATVVAVGLLAPPGAGAAGAGPSPGAARTVIGPRPHGSPTVLPVQELALPVQDLIFPSASADGAVTDEGRDRYTLASDVLFAFDKAALTPRARQEIARIAAALRTGGHAVTVTGYTDDVGSQTYNLGLSARRARAVRAELLRTLGSAVTVTAAGRGEDDPVAKNDTAAGRAADRRVEIRGS